MAEGGEGFDEAVLIPAGVSAWAKEVGPLIVVDSVDFLAEGGKEGDDFRADEARGAGDEKLHRVELWGIGGISESGKRKGKEDWLLGIGGVRAAHF